MVYEKKKVWILINFCFKSIISLLHCYYFHILSTLLYAVKFSNATNFTSEIVSFAKQKVLIKLIATFCFLKIQFRTKIVCCTVLQTNSVYY